MEIDTKELKQKVSIIDYVANHYKEKLPIEKMSGDTAFIKCPWHKEDTASLALFANGSYKCFGCGESGDIITLVQYMENVSFLEACKIIGDNIGYPINLIPPNPYHESYKDTMDNHTRRYWVNLHKNKEALNYLMIERGLTEETINQFRLGLTDSEEFKYRSDMGNISSKITFPILEHTKKPKCVGIAYRAIANEKPKYINDHNQEGKDGQNPNYAGVFIKGNMLYGYPMAMQSVKENKFAFVVEGYFDVISMHQSGLTNTVGIMGTTITQQQIKELKRITNTIVLMLDNDNAGITATLKQLPDLYKEGLDVYLCQLPGVFKDPDEMCRTYDYNGNNIYTELKHNLIRAIEYVINEKTIAYNKKMNEEKIKILNEISPLLSSISDNNLHYFYREYFKKQLGI